VVDVLIASREWITVYSSLARLGKRRPPHYRKETLSAVFSFSDAFDSKLGANELGGGEADFRKPYSIRIGLGQRR
jgi:hypothetical protein